MMINCRIWVNVSDDIIQTIIDLSRLDVMKAENKYNQKWKFLSFAHLLNMKIVHLTFLLDIYLIRKKHYG